MSSSRVIKAAKIVQLDVVLSVAGFRCPSRIVSGIPARQRYKLPDLPVGPTFDDLRGVIEFLRQKRKRIGKPLRIGAYGGARLLAATALSVGLIERRLGDNEDVGSLSTDHENWIKDGSRKAQLAAEVVMLPATILAAQAAPAKTWICNDPTQESTFWASSDNLIAGSTCLDFVKVKHGIAIVAGVLLECVYGSPRKTIKTEDAATAKIRARELLAELGRDLSANADIRVLAELAYASRAKCENVIGPDMPGLALKQAVERVLYKHGVKRGTNRRVSIDADCVAAWLIPDVSDELGRDRSGFAAFNTLRALWPRPDIPQKYFERIADAAASTTLAKRCERATPEFYNRILHDNLKHRR